MKGTITGIVFVAMSLPAFGNDTPVHDKLPEDKGKQETARVCTGCHTIDTVITERHDRVGWQKVVDTMASRGADGTDEELKLIVDYLTKNFGPKESTNK
jgi:hypothetical protein